MTKPHIRLRFKNFVADPEDPDVMRRAVTVVADVLTVEDGAIVLWLDGVAVYQHPLDLLAAVELDPDQPAGSASSPSAPAYSVDQIRKHHQKAYQRWTEEDDQLLLDLHDDGRSVEELSAALGRQTGGIRSRLTKLGVPLDELPDLHEAAAPDPSSG